ncbi:MAG TPA: hypothetical protein VJS17_05455 [Pyrinomonadaceae bacterium]|nr:hypothetical protein [Pyrinomonadaceae bacterium]
MEYDITDTIAILVRKADSNFEQELDEQDEALRGLECTNPYYGEWLDMGVELLFSIFELEDHDFARKLPDLAHLSKSARGQFIKHVESHLHECDHCALKQQHEQFLNSKIEEAFNDNRELLIQQLEEEESRSSNANINETSESYLCASTTSIDASSARPSRQYRHPPRRGGH